MRKVIGGKIAHRVISALVMVVAVVVMQVVVPTPAPAHVIPKPCDFTTGGGFVFHDDGVTRVNFGIVGGCKNEGFFGHVNVVDHGSGAHINGPVTAYYDPIIDGSPYRDLCGTDKKTGVKFRVRTRDKGEPGGLDLFGIKLSDGRILTTRELGPPGEQGGGGNIQLHKPNPSTTGPSEDPGEINTCGATDEGLGF